MAKELEGQQLPLGDTEEEVTKAETEGNAPEEEQTETTDTNEEETPAEDLTPEQTGLDIKVLKGGDEGTLSATTMDFLMQNLRKDYQVQLHHESFDQPLVFDFKIISPDRMWLEVDTPIIPELERFTIANADKPDTPLPRDLQRKVRRRNLIAELDLMDIVLCAAVTSPPLTKDDKGNGVPLSVLPDPIKTALFNAIWQVSAPTGAEDYMAIFRRQGKN